MKLILFGGTLLLYFNVLGQTSSKFDLKDIETVNCLPKIALIQNYLGTKGFKLIETKTLGENFDNYQYALKLKSGTTTLSIDVIKNVIVTFKINSTDQEFIKNLHQSCTFLGYDKIKPMNEDTYPNAELNWWQKTIAFSRVEVRFVLNGYVGKDKSISYQFFIEKS